MIYAPLPLPILILCIVSFCVFVFKTRKPARTTPSPMPTVPRNSYSSVRATEDAHKGYQKETAEVSVLDTSLSRITLKQPLGTPVSLVFKNNGLYLVVDNHHISRLTIAFDSKVRHIVKNNLPYKAYITDRQQECSGFYDFITLTIYYKLD